MAKKTKILHIQGNPITIGFPVVQASAELRDGSLVKGNVPQLIGDAWVVLRNGLFVRQYKVIPTFNYVHFTDNGHLPCGEYDIELYYDDEDGQHMRLKYPSVLSVVDSTEDGQVYDSTDYDVIAYYPVIEGRASAVVIGDGYVALMAGNGLNADIGDHSVNLRAGYGNSTIAVEDNKVKIQIKE